MAAIPISNICIICKADSENGVVVTVTRGIETLKSVSVQRKDDIHNIIRNLDSITIHAECRRKYTLIKKGSFCYKNVGPPKRELSPLSPVKKRLRVEPTFNFKTLCFLCGQEASKQLKREKKRRDVIRTVQTPGLKDTVLKMIAGLPDKSMDNVRTRILTQDLQAAEARYHTSCFTSLSRSAEVKKPKECTITKSEMIAKNMQVIYDYIETSDDVQFTLAEFAEILGENAPCPETIKSHLRQRYGCDMVRFTPKAGASTIVSFRDSDYSILKKSMQEKNLDVAAEKIRILETAASIIRNDIMRQVCDTDSYPSSDEFLEDVNADIPESLQYLVDKIVLQNKKGSLDSYRVKCTSVCHAIMSAVRPRSFLSPLSGAPGALKTRKPRNSLRVNEM
ncbi:PREDICTED: uncharacterized protein LOC108760767, partial [Trachymyrmex cornetzi]|uniref:uncharacterized protein LOC108760767 n=1 Tax=Trachymyrmex cornetzi TaxID=471704 RepID=UPI00084EEDE5